MRAKKKKPRAPTKRRSKQPPRRSKSIVPFLTQDEISRLFGVIKNKRDQAIFHLAYHHGLRASEVSLLQRNDVDLKQGRITIHQVKGSLSSVNSLTPADAKRLRSYLRTRTDESPYLFISNRGVPIDRRTLWYLVQHYGEKAGIPKEKRTFHILKHSICTHLLDAGADISFVKDWVGHANIQNTTIYARLTTARRDDQARKLFASPRVR